MNEKKTKKWNAEDFLTRAEKGKLLRFPESTAERVIVKCNNEAMGFKFNCYEPQYLSEHVEKSRFDQTVKGCQKICDRLWRLKKSEEGAEYNKNYKYLLILAILISFTGFLFLILDIYAGVENLAVAAIVLLVIAAVMTAIVVILSLFSEPKFMDLESEIKESLGDYLGEENSSFYRPKGLNWSVQEHFYWLELSINQEIKITTSPEEE